MTGENRVIGGILVLTVVILVGIMLMGGNNAPAPIEAKSVDKGELVRSDSIKLGSDEAKVKMVEFLDYQCPACKNAHPVIKQVLKDRGDSVQLIVRHFPLSSIHPHADNAARATEAANLQGKFWEMHDKLFETQKSWETATNSKDIFAVYGRDLGLNIEQFTKDYNDQKILDRISQDKGDGNALGVDSTPTLFINGQKYTGEMTVPTLTAKIDELLK